MTDWLDRAKEREELERELALNAQRAMADFSAPSLDECAECGEPIPEARRALGGVTRCVACQTLFEKSTRR
ncbi:TraR/DksA family transcriptional regulator [Pseudomonas sp. A-1]|uniref:TraR/DksA family transcriptional regulator n=1 Tax=Pseudomonas sp. A-1 TaxID=1821274 RepID=UPI0010A5A6D1|nr:TraR/DksA family transcriptional regulator [Pseudomonas sp. A-1]THG81506.1 TraR/DksA family transcriptional regulator [Pseudomonas sp. A-1]